MANYVYIATSLDGYIAESDGGIEFLDKIPNTEGSDMGWSQFISKIDALVMGRNSFEKVQSFGFWPYELPVYVLSRTLTELPKEYEGKAFLTQGTPLQVMEELGEKGYQNLYIDGGIVVQEFLKEDLIDHLIVTKIPVLLGSGIPLFGKMDQPLWFRLEKAETHLGELVTNHYVRDKTRG